MGTGLKIDILTNTGQDKQGKKTPKTLCIMKIKNKEKK